MFAKKQYPMTMCNQTHRMIRLPVTSSCMLEASINVAVTSSNRSQSFTFVDIVILLWLRSIDIWRDNLHWSLCANALYVCLRVEILCRYLYDET